MPHLNRSRRNAKAAARKARADKIAQRTRAEPGDSRAAIAARYPEPPKTRESYDRPAPQQPACYAPEPVANPPRGPKPVKRQRFPAVWRGRG